jgi:hypothetical protein
MVELELTRRAGDRRLYELAGVGSVRMKGWASRTAGAEANAHSWEIARRGLFSRMVEATDEAGKTVGQFRARGLRRGGTLRWSDRELSLRPASRWRQRYALADGDRELAVFEGRGRGRRWVRVTLDDPRALDPGLVLFTAFVVGGLAQDASAAAGAAAGT